MILDQLPNVSEAFRQTYEVATNIVTSPEAKGTGWAILIGTPLALLYNRLMYPERWAEHRARLREIRNEVRNTPTPPSMATRHAANVARRTP